VLLAAAAALLGLLVVPGAAPPATPAGPHSGTATRPAAGSVASARQAQSDVELARYWTPTRRAKAVDADVLTRTGSQDTEPPAQPPREALLGDQVAPYAGGGPAARFDGALFTTIGGTDYACSGSVVTSPGHDLVMTAGHCLHSGGLWGSFATNVIFIPGYAHGDAPYGIWHARQLTVTAGWGYQRDFDEDAGFAAFRPLGARNLQDALGGGFPIAFAQGPTPAAGPQTVLGYPKLPPFDGSTLMTCTGSTAPDPRGGHSRGLPCAMTAGASGGAWLSNFHDGTGTLDSLVSYAYAADPGTIYGTWFGPAVHQLYERASEL
jgi:hypothetical protein